MYALWIRELMDIGERIVGRSSRPTVSFWCEIRFNGTNISVKNCEGWWMQ